VQRMPNLFIVGAPKCGTTALTRYLRHHPDVFVARKELHYFGQDLTFRNKQRLTLPEYLAFYDGALTQRYRCDSSVWYMSSTTAAKEIAEAAPGARLIVMLRNPVDMLYSLHSELLFQGDEDIPDFAEALDAEEDRREGRRIPPDSDIPWALQYRDIARFSAQIERFFGTFDTTSVHVILYDELAADPGLIYRRLLEFLEIDPEVVPEFPVVNSNKIVRSPFVRQFLRYPPEPLRRIGRLALRTQESRRSFGKRLVLANTTNKARQTLDPQLRARLEEEFVPEVEHLAELIGRDLSSWMKPSAS
jgi:hypothetical protein